MNPLDGGNGQLCLPWASWAMVLALQVIISITYAIVLPSMHQFVTASTDGGPTPALSSGNTSGINQVYWANY